MTDMIQMKTALGRKIVASLIKKFIKAKTGYDMDVFINDLVVKHDPENSAAINLNVAIKVDNDTLKDICSSIYGR